MPEMQVVAVPPVPPATNIATGSTFATGTASPVPMIVIAAGRTWQGNMTLTAANNVTTGARQDARVVVNGSTVSPPDTSVILAAISYRDTAPGVSYLANITITAGTSGATVNLVNSTATTFSSCVSYAGTFL